jgi:hypothetical protein
MIIAADNCAPARNFWRVGHSPIEELQLLALAATILALGAVYCLVRDQDHNVGPDQLAQRQPSQRKPAKVAIEAAMSR